MYDNYIFPLFGLKPHISSRWQRTPLLLKSTPSYCFTLTSSFPTTAHFSSILTVHSKFLVDHPFLSQSDLHGFLAIPNPTPTSLRTHQDFHSLNLISNLCVTQRILYLCFLCWLIATQSFKASRINSRRTSLMSMPRLSRLQWVPFFIFLEFRTRLWWIIGVISLKEITPIRTSTLKMTTILREMMTQTKSTGYHFPKWTLFCSEYQMAGSQVRNRQMLQ